jgi:hypothetical protein
VAPDPKRRFDTIGAALSAAGMLFIVLGILQAGNNWLLLVVFLAVGAGLQLWFFLDVRSVERAGREPLLSTSLFRNRTSNLAMVTQNIQWLLLMGSMFVVTVFLQVIHGFSAVKTGVVFTAATAGILVSSRHLCRGRVTVGVSEARVSARCDFDDDDARGVPLQRAVRFLFGGGRT